MPFVDGDDLHPQVNIDKMAAGEPLTDADREPWLKLIRKKAEEVLVAEEDRAVVGDYLLRKPNTKARGVVVACSALKKSYRDILRRTTTTTTNKGLLAEMTDCDCNNNKETLCTYFVFIKGERELLRERMEKRDGHFMKINMLESQLSTLEEPTDGEEDVVVVSLEAETDEQVGSAREGLRSLVDISL